MSDSINNTVTVVVPAYNAAATISETLSSIRAQLYTDLDIIVVDDGSSDRTPQIVEQHAAQDARIRLIRQANGGVAKARNRGLAEAKGHFVAPVDADDLWRPAKIARQVALARERGPGVSLVYTWYATIDEESRVTAIVRPSHEGDVMGALCAVNFVGHASSPLMQTQQVLQVGGYDPSLRARGAQGCEDWQLYMKLAEIGAFAVVPSPLTGYRVGQQSMSGDFIQMMRSHHIVMSQFRQMLPQYSRELRRGWYEVGNVYLRKSIDAFRYKAALAAFWQYGRTDPGFCAYILSSFAGSLSPAKIRRFLRRTGPRVVSGAGQPRFLDADDDTEPASRTPGVLAAPMPS